MSLFAMSRYLGEPSTETSPGKSPQAQAILARLNARAQKREQEREQKREQEREETRRQSAGASPRPKPGGGATNSASPDTPTKSAKNKKKKKNGPLVDVNEEEVERRGISSESGDVPPQIKGGKSPKKEKRKVSNGDRRSKRSSETVEDEELQTSVAKKKKAERVPVLEGEDVKNGKYEKEEEGDRTANKKMRKESRKERRTSKTNRKKDQSGDLTQSDELLPREHLDDGVVEMGEEGDNSSEQDAALGRTKEGGEIGETDEAMMEDDGGSHGDDAGSHGDDGEEEETGFQVLGDFERRSKKKMKETLPDWLARPFVIKESLTDCSAAVSSIKGLDERLVKVLAAMGIEHLFPVQRHVIPALLASIQSGVHCGPAGFRPRDICVSAPTGSGKTLAYSIPIVQALLDRVVPRVRALVVLPTRDLATQVHKVICGLCQATPLKAVLIGGSRAFAHEQSQLVRESDGEFHSAADIVVATPGRLVDNLQKTVGFSLKHLRFLVIDEADRMMDPIIQDWLAQVEKSAYSLNTPPPHNGSVLESVTPGRPRPGPLTIARCSLYHTPLQKLLFSATLSQNPEKLTQLRLFQPRLFTTATGSRHRPLTMSPGRGVSSGDGGMEGEGMEENGEERSDFVGQYTTPAGLSEFFVQCTAGEKPLVLHHLLVNLYFKQVICFTNTLEATHRLCVLLQLMGGVEVAEVSSQLRQSERQAILKRFKAGKIQILVCSDAMARGMDIDNVKCVISYDLPPHLKTYIHRVGRTARAGKAGTAFSFIRKKEVTKFKQMLRNAGKDSIQRHRVSANQLEALTPAYTEALSQLSAALKEEKPHHH